MPMLKRHQENVSVRLSQFTISLFRRCHGPVKNASDVAPFQCIMIKHFRNVCCTVVPVPGCNLLLQVQLVNCSSCIRDAITCCKFSCRTVLLYPLQSLVASSVGELFFTYP